MSDETTLLPCPICGKKVSIARTENEVGERWWFITRGTCKTTRCNCRLFLESEKFTCDWNDDYSLECRAKLVEKWNTRATHGTLTAEQVREAAKSNSRKYKSPVDDGVWIREYDWQAIADELNAELGSGTSYDELLRCLERDWNISASWDGLRRFWCIELTEEGVRLRDEWNARAERTCRIVEYDDAPIPVCSECGAVQPDDYAVYYCWSCGAKVRNA